MSQLRVTAKRPAATALALWFAVAAVSVVISAAPTLADETEAADIPVTDADQQAGSSAAEGDTVTEPDPESPSSIRPRSRVLRPDPSDVEDPLEESRLDDQELRGTRGGEGVIGCVAGCSEPLRGTMSPTPDQAATQAGLLSAGGIVCVAGC
jgi:hypothetical protein